ncbi:MAG: preprotein translocase subunit SecY [Phycisphaeraceae bacterium]|nr:preprotein translocase subunit SecY [Phycisphaeraceae bacterium]
MLQAFLNIWRINELRNKLLFTLGMLAIYRIGFFIPLLGVDQSSLSAFAEKSQDTAMGNLISFVGIFTGGNFSQSTIFGLGIMPYISSSIIFQLLGTVVPSFQQLQKEGPAGRQKIVEYTRYGTVALAIVQGWFWLSFIQSNQLVYPEYSGTFMFVLSGLLALTAGAVFLMWLGEQIDKYGIGNGASLIITAGIIAGMPGAIGIIAEGFSMTGDQGSYTPWTVILLLAAFITVVAGSILITQGQRRIPIQQAKHTRGRRVYGGQKSYLPLRVNHGGVMPIIFASSLMMFPSLLFGWLVGVFEGNSFCVFLDRNFRDPLSFPYLASYVGMIFFFAYFWTTVQFQPKEMATQLRDHGSFIPGLRPGPRTAEYLETVMERITYVGAGFLAVIAVIPSVVAGYFEIPFAVTSFLGGTGLLIVVSVMLDFVQRIEAGLMMRNYPGFLAGAGGKGPKIRGSRPS